MGYKIFYSYQSDIDSNLNKKFIRTAIKNAIANITEYDIDPLIEGFSNASGNPPLAKTMFDESRNSDIFIADVTFTMAKEWHNPIKLNEDDESISIQIPKGNLKPSPNPNVLLETGYSWALKDYDRTILVMNNAFGHPKNLPVDMDGLRWPITYKLSLQRAAITKKYDKELNGLSASLEIAIRAAIKSNIHYQLEKFKPFKIHSQWRRQHSFPYRLTPNLKGKLADLRNALINYKGPVRMTGLVGTGKSRLAFEIFLENEELDINELNESILYYDLLATGYGDISKQVNDLSNLNQLKIVIIDNCDLMTHKRLDVEFIGTKIRLLTINTVFSSLDIESANIFIDEYDSLKINEILINERFSGLKASFLIEKLGGNISNTITIIESSLKDDDDEIGNSLISFITEVISTENIQKGALEFLSTINLFGRIGISGMYINEINNIKKSFFSSKSDYEIEELIDILVSKKLLVKKGDFIIVNTFNEELLGDWLFRNNNNLTKQINEIAKIRLLDKFAIQLKGVFKREKSKALINSLFQNEGILQNEEFVDSNEGSLLLNRLVEDMPEQVLKIMSNIIEKK